MSKKIKITLTVLVVLILGAGFSTYYFYSKYQSLKKNPNASSQEEVKDLVNKVSQLIELPTGEDPTLATVQDKEKLKDQSFFQNTENGDKVLIYIKAKKAFLYRPTANKVIDVAPLVMSDNKTPSTNEQEKNLGL